MLRSGYFESVPNADDAREYLYQWRLLGFRARAYVQISASLGMSVALIGWSSIANQSLRSIHQVSPGKSKMASREFYRSENNRKHAFKARFELCEGN